MELNPDNRYWLCEKHGILPDNAIYHDDEYRHIGCDGVCVEIEDVAGLLALRKKWEGNHIGWKVDEWKRDFPTLYVILENNKNHTYRLHRYFNIAGEWAVSVDMKDITAKEMIGRLFRRVVRQGGLI